MRHILYKYLTGASMIALTFSLNTSTANATCSPMPTCESMGYTQTSCPSGIKSLKCPFDESKLLCIQDCTGYTLNSCDSNKGACFECNGKYKYAYCYTSKSFVANDGGCECKYGGYTLLDSCPAHANCTYHPCNTNKYGYDGCESGYEEITSWNTSLAFCAKEIAVGDPLTCNGIDVEGTVFYRKGNIIKVIAPANINANGDFNSGTASLLTMPSTLPRRNGSNCYKYDSIYDMDMDRNGLKNTQCLIGDNTDCCDENNNDWYTGDGTAIEAIFNYHTIETSSCDVLPTRIWWWEIPANGDWMLIQQAIASGMLPASTLNGATRYWSSTVEDCQSNQNTYGWNGCDYLFYFAYNASTQQIEEVNPGGTAAVRPIITIQLDW